jgi:electron-transferring-flavoprotein dehydrogenase
MNQADRQTMEVDIVCVGFGPAAGGFLTTLSRELMNEDGTPRLESRVMPGMPLQVLCYERADDIAFAVSGVVTRARGIRASFPDLDPSQIPMAVPVAEERMVYLLDPHGAGRRPLPMRVLDALFRVANPSRQAIELPLIPAFLNKHGGLVLSIGQFNQWVGQQLMMSGMVQIWPATPVSEPLLEGRAVTGVRLVDQGVERDGSPGPAYMPGMDIKAGLTVVADGPVGAVGRKLDQTLGMPAGNHHREWALGMKFVIGLPDGVDLVPGTVIHTVGYPEPEIFGFFYVHPDRLASAGIFIPSWFDCPVASAYRYLQHFIRHPYLWRWLEGGRLRSWGAKSIQESGRRGEPYLAGDGFARIGEGSGSTNVLSASGIDEAWITGVQLAESVIHLARQGRPFTRDNLEATYVRRRRESWVDKESLAAEKSRDGFHHGVVAGMIGMALAGYTNGLITIPGAPQPKPKGPRLPDRFPPIEHDGQLLVSHQDALLMGGKVQAAPGYADHVRFVDLNICADCESRRCAQMCSGEAIAVSIDVAYPSFDREKCVHCGACIWNCPEDNVAFSAGAGGFHSSEN